MLLTLTTPGEGTEDTRRRVARSQLGESESVDAVLQELVKGRLVTISQSDPPQVEVTHEALIRGWHELRQWLDADRESLRTLQQLLDAAEAWQKHGEDPAYLYAGSRLVQAEEWRSANQQQLAELPLAVAFIDAAAERRDAEQRRREAEEQQRLEVLQKLADEKTARAAEADKRAAEQAEAARKIQKRSRWIAIAGIASFIFAGLAIWGLLHSRSQRVKAETAETIARDERDAAEKAVASGFVHSLGHNESAAPLNPIELNALWELATVENERIHELFVAIGLRGPDEARHLRRRLEVAVQAAVGLREDRRAAIRDALIVKLRDAKASEMVQGICVDMGLALRVTDPEFSALALKRVVGKRQVRRWSDEEFVFLANHLDPTDALQIAENVVDLLKNNSPDSTSFRPSYREEFPAELPILLNKLDPVNARPLATTYVELLLKNFSSDEYVDPWSLRKTAESYATIAEFLGDDDAKTNAEALAKRIGDAAKRFGSPYELENLAEAIKPLEQFTNVSNDAKKLVDHFRTIATKRETASEIMGAQPDDSPPRLELWYVSNLTRCFVAVAHFMTDEDAEMLAESLARACLQALDNVSFTEQPQDADNMARIFWNAKEVFETLPPHLKDANLQAEIIERLDGDGQVEKQCVLIYLLKMAMDQLPAGKLSTAEAEQLWKQAADRLFVDKSAPGQVGGEDASRLIGVAADQSNNMEVFDEFLNAFHELSEHAPEDIRRELGDPFAYAESEEFLNVLIQRVAMLKTRSFGPYDVFVFKEAVKTATPSQRADLARGILRHVAQKVERLEVSEYYPPIITHDVELRPLGAMSEQLQQQAPRQVYGFWWIAHDFAEVANALDETETATAARTILDRTEDTQWVDPMDIAGLAKMLISLAPNLSEQDALQLTQRIALRFETIRDLNNQVSMLHAFRALAAKLPTETLIELLKWPNCVGMQRMILLEKIGSRVNQKFASVWDVVAWARESDPKKTYASLKLPPRRPSDDAIRSGERLEPADQSDADIEPLPRFPAPPPPKPDNRLPRSAKKMILRLQGPHLLYAQLIQFTQTLDGHVSGKLRHCHCNNVRWPSGRGPV